MITPQMVHEAFRSTTPTAREWPEVSPAAKAAYAKMAAHLNTAAGLRQPCPFCAFYEKPARPVAPGAAIGPVGCCTACGDMHPDITEMLLEWLEEQT
jgi:hypothetical protein